MNSDNINIEFDNWADLIRLLDKSVDNNMIIKMWLSTFEYNNIDQKDEVDIISDQIFADVLLS